MYRVNPIRIYILLYVCVYIKTMRHGLTPALEAVPALDVSLYTILSLSKLYDVWHIKKIG